MIAENLKQVLSELPEKVRLVAVSKFHPNEAIEEAYRAGQRVFGESKVQEMTAKYESLPKDIEWHFIGHLQTNKIKYIVPYVALIHGIDSMTAKYESLPKDIEWHFIGHLQTNKIKYIVPYVALIHGIDSYKLLAEVNKQAAKAGKTVNCLLQLHIAREETKFGFSFDECREMLAAGEWRKLNHIRICGLMGMATNCLLQLHIAREETKFGFSFDECREMLAAGEWRKLNHIRICGLMGMATNTDNDEQIKTEFCSLSSFFNEVKAKWFADAESFRELSMGMSHDYHEAIAAGSTLIRVGSKIFGERNY